MAKNNQQENDSIKLGDPKIVGNNDLDQAPKTGKNYRKVLDNPRLKQEIIEAFDKNRGNTREEKIEVLQREVRLLEKEIGINQRHSETPLGKLDRKTINTLDKIKFGKSDLEIKEINEDFEKRLFTEKSPVGENIKKVLFEKQYVNVVDVANDLAKIEDEKTRFYLFLKLIDRGGNKLFNPHSNNNGDIFSTKDINTANEIIGLAKYGIQPTSSRTSTGMYYGYYRHIVEPILETKGVTIKGGYGLKYAGTYGNNSIREKIMTFILPVFSSDPEYIELQKEFFEKYPNQKQKCIKAKDNLTKLTKETNDIFDRYKIKREKITNQIKKIEDIIKDKRSEIYELREENEIIAKRSKNNADAYRNFKKEHGDAELLKELVINTPDFDLEKFLITTPYEFIAHCQRLHMRPCTDGKHQIAIKIDEAPSVNTGAGLQYGKNVSIWYNGKIQDTQYFKWRDGYNSSNDIPSNSFNKIRDISVDDETGEVKVLAQSGNDYPKTIKFQIEKTNKENEIPENEQMEFEKKFETAKLEILKIQTRNANTALSYNLAYRGDVVSGQDPYREVPYEEAKVISQAIDYSRGLGAIVISTQIDASAASGRQMGYYAYIIHPNGSREEVRSDNLHASDMKNGKTVNIPDANSLIKQYRNKKELV